MGEVVKQTRNIFIDSETNTSLDDTLVQINLIPTDFWCASDENMRMTLTTLELRNNWYNLNTYNTIFYIFINFFYYLLFILYSLLFFVSIN